METIAWESIVLAPATRVISPLEYNPETLSYPSARSPFDQVVLRAIRDLIAPMRPYEVGGQVRNSWSGGDPSPFTNLPLALFAQAKYWGGLSSEPDVLTFLEHQREVGNHDIKVPSSNKAELLAVLEPQKIAQLVLDSIKQSRPSYDTNISQTDQQTVITIYLPKKDLISPVFCLAQGVQVTTSQEEVKYTITFQLCPPAGNPRMGNIFTCTSAVTSRDNPSQTLFPGGFKIRVSPAGGIDDHRGGPLVNEFQYLKRPISLWDDPIITMDQVCRTLATALSSPPPDGLSQEVIQSAPPSLLLVLISRVLLNLTIESQTRPPQDIFGNQHYHRPENSQTTNQLKEAVNRLTREIRPPTDPIPPGLIAEIQARLLLVLAVSPHSFLRLAQTINLNSLFPNLPTHLPKNDFFYRMTLLRPRFNPSLTDFSPDNHFSFPDIAESSRLSPPGRSVLGRCLDCMELKLS